MQLIDEIRHTAQAYILANEPVDTVLLGPTVWKTFTEEAEYCDVRVRYNAVSTLSVWPLMLNIILCPGIENHGRRYLRTLAEPNNAIKP